MFVIKEAVLQALLSNLDGVMDYHQLRPTAICSVRMVYPLERLHLSMTGGTVPTGTTPL